MGGIKKLGWLVLGLCAALLAACGSANEVRVGAGENGGRVELKSGQVVAVTLESNPSTGYAWEVVEIDAALLALQGEAEFKQEDTGGELLVGASGTETLRFQAAGKGETTLKLVYHRSWETDVEPLLTYTLQVTVR